MAHPELRCWYPTGSVLSVSGILSLSLGICSPLVCIARGLVGHSSALGRLTFLDAHLSGFLAVLSFRLGAMSYIHNDLQALQEVVM